MEALPTYQSVWFADSFSLAILFVLLRSFDTRLAVLGINEFCEPDYLLTRPFVCSRWNEVRVHAPRVSESERCRYFVQTEKAAHMY